MDLEKRLSELIERREGAHMPHIYYGDPNPEFSHRLLTTLATSGADILEFGIPFSDPTADGGTFQGACERSLKAGVTPVTCLEGIKELRRSGIDLPVIVTTYYNIPYRMGLDSFMKNLKTAGTQGVIIPNLPIEEAEPLRDAGEKHGIHVIMLVAPTTTENRLKQIADRASGFIYIMNVEGVTGARESITTSTLRQVQRVRKHTDIPLMAGFGISRREHAKAVVQAGADGAIAGSVYTKIYEQNLEFPERCLDTVSYVASELKKGCIEGYLER